MAAADTVFVDQNQKFYLLTSWMDKIPVSPSDAKLRDRLFTNIPDRPFLEPILIIRNRQVYVSSKHLNFLLATSTAPLLINFVFADDDEGAQKIDVSLTDMEGRQILMDCPAEGFEGGSGSLGETQIQLGQNRSAYNNRELGAPPTPSPGDYNNSQPSKNSAERRNFRAVQEWQDGIGDDNKQARATIEGAADALHDNSITVTTQDQTFDLARDIIEKTAAPSSSSWTLASAALGELKDLKFSDTKAILLHLLDDHFPPCLVKFSEAADEHVHLATMKNGQTFWVKIFSSLDTYPDDFMCPTLNDPALKDLPISKYQSNELTRILKDISKTEPGKLFRSWVDSVEPADAQKYREKINGQVMDFRKLLTNIKAPKIYKNLQGFLGDLALLADNAKKYHGKAHEQTVAAQLVVDHVHRSMSRVSAIEKAEVQAFTGSFGLVREVVLISTKKRSGYTGPKYVLPLGMLHCSADRGAEKEECPDVVLMDVMSHSKAIWLFHREPDRCVFTMLTHDIGLWKADSADGLHDGGLTKNITSKGGGLRRVWLTEDYNHTKNRLSDVLVYFRRAPRSLAAEEKDSDSDSDEPLAKRRKFEIRRHK